jgi:hypothetical protein
MRRGLLACLIASVIAVASAGAATTPPPRASLQGFVCQRASNSLSRAIQVIAVMRPRAGTQRMELRFVLLRRSTSGGMFSPVRGGDLGQWHEATLGQRPGDVWRRKQVVANLGSPAVYRFRVSFRWFGASGSALGRQSLFSSLCYQSQ